MLSSSDIKHIIDIIIKGYEPEKIYLFGSYVNGIPNKDSGLDICILKQPPSAH